MGVEIRWRTISTGGKRCSSRQSAWYAKEEATFVDVLAVVRQEIWRTQLVNWPTPVHTPNLANSPNDLHPAFASLLEAACYAA